MRKLVDRLNDHPKAVGLGLAFALAAVVVGVIQATIGVATLAHDVYAITAGKEDTKASGAASVGATPGPTATASPTPSASPSDSPSPPRPSDTGSASARPSSSSASAEYGEVPMATLCNNARAAVYICGSQFGGTKEVGGEIFSYVGEGNGNAIVKPPNWGRLLEFPENTCKALVVSFVTDASRGEATIRVVQTGKPATIATVPHNRRGLLTAELNGSPFYLQYNSTTGRPVFVNGHATCRSESGT